MKKYDVIILGGGASGLMCAAYLNKNSSLKVAVVEGASKVAQKLKISGGGKCNITNVSVSEINYLGDEQFVKSMLERFGKDDLLHFLAQRGLKPIIRNKRYYFCPKSSDEIIELLKNECSGVDIFLNEKIITLKKDEDFTLMCDHSSFSAKSVVVATGGESYKSVGATSIGLEIAKSFDIGVKNFTPALVGLTLQPDQFWMRELSGISLYAHIKVDNKTLKEDLLFAHKGISGLVTLSASLYWKKGLIRIDFYPDNQIDFSSKKHISSSINLSKRFLKLFLQSIKIEDKPLNRLTPEEKEIVTNQLHNYTFAPSGTFGFTKAEASRGGVITDELDENMQSKKVKDLYFIGEVVDVTGELGGYNFQWAFTSGTICARHMV